MSAAEVGRSDTAVDGSVVPIGSHSTVVVAVEVCEKVAAAAFDLAKAKCVHSERHTLECLIEGGCASFWTRSCFSTVVGSFYCVCCCPLF